MARSASGTECLTYDLQILKQLLQALPGFFAGLARYYARLEMAKFVVFEQEYRGLFYGAPMLAGTVGVVVAENYLGVPEVIQGYTFLGGLVATGAVTVWKQYEDSAVGKILGNLARERRAIDPEGDVVHRCDLGAMVIRRAGADPEA